MVFPGLGSVRCPWTGSDGEGPQQRGWEAAGEALHHWLGAADHQQPVSLSPLLCTFMAGLSTRMLCGIMPVLQQRPEVSLALGLRASLMELVYLPLSCPEASNLCKLI